MQEQDFFDAYNRRLEYYKKKFNRDKFFPFTEIKFKDGNDKKISGENFFDMYMYDLILIPSNYHEIFDEIIDFTALLSFLPVEFRFNYLSKLVFLLHFKKSDNNLIETLWTDINDYVLKMMIKIVFTDFLQHFFLKDIIITDLLFEFSKQINPPLLEDVFFTIFINWLRFVYSKKITIGTMRDIISKTSNLSSFNDFSRANIEIYEKYSIKTSLLFKNYSKIGFNHFFIWIKFNNIRISQKILERFFYPFSFFSHFLFINRICQFSCFIPASFKRTIINYLNSLQNLKIIESFYFDLIIESKYILEFENSLARNQKIYEMIPFKSKKFRQNKSIPPNIKNLPPFALVKHYQTYPKPSLKIDSTLDALDFFIFFKIGNLLIENRKIHNLIEKNLLISTLCDLNSKHMKNSYTLLFSDNLISENTTSINEMEKLLKNKFPKKKSVDKLISLFKILKISDTSDLKRNFFDKWNLKLGKEFNRCFSKRSNHSMNQIKKKFIQLVEKGTLKKYINFFPFFIINPNLIYLNISSKSSLDIIKCVFWYAKKKCKNTFVYEFFPTTDTYLLLSKYILQDNLISIGIPYEFGSSFIDFNIISFFDFNKKDWDELKMKKNLQSFLKETKFEKDIPNINVNFDHWEKKLPIFQFGDFFKDLRYFNKLNEISRYSNINREKIIRFFKNYIKNQQFNFSQITDKFNFNVKSLKFPTLEKKKRIFIIISQSGTNINPFILKNTQFFSIFFSDFLQNGWFYGGYLDNILILEYLVKKEDFLNKESKWGRSIEVIKAKYPFLNIKIFELKEDLRFFNEYSLYSFNWYYNDYNYLKQTSTLELDDLEVKNEISFIFDSKFHCDKYYPRFLPWEFWHIIDYPVSVAIIIECLKNELNLVKKLIKRLPAGQIFTFKKDGKSKEIELLAIVQLKNYIDRFFENIIPALNKFNCKYYISLIVPLSIYGEKFIAK